MSEWVDAVATSVVGLVYAVIVGQVFGIFDGELLDRMGLGFLMIGGDRDE